MYVGIDPASGKEGAPFRTQVRSFDADTGKEEILLSGLEQVQLVGAAPDGQSLYLSGREDLARVSP
ncbi:hypothetical protein N6H14_07550 [Paenibacillus sp. CC-CFT747]|nr:hypothetical protein N6H14_07550 [Paenibacillus sp. CC-CFT747]